VSVRAHDDRYDGIGTLESRRGVRSHDARYDVQISTSPLGRVSRQYRAIAVEEGVGSGSGRATTWSMAASFPLHSEVDGRFDATPVSSVGYT